MVRLYEAKLQHRIINQVSRHGTTGREENSAARIWPKQPMIATLIRDDGSYSIVHTFKCREHSLGLPPSRSKPNRLKRRVDDAGSQFCRQRLRELSQT